MNDFPVLSVRNIRKVYPGVVALDAVDLAVRAGEVLSVIGENGAGKSTLMKILAGLVRADGGELLLDGQRTTLESPASALGHGIVLIHQELNLAPNLDAGSNIFLGREPRRFGFIDQPALHIAAKKWLAAVGATFPSETPLAALSTGQQQLVEIAKALSFDARVLIMDEPTSSLSAHETEKLMQLVLRLRDQGVAIVYISHRLAEVQRLSDRVVVLRDGRRSGELAKDQISHGAMVRLMVGRDIEATASGATARSEVALSVRGLRTQENPREAVSFDVHAGEVVGLAGLVGAGRSELLRAVFGITPRVAGVVEVNREPVTNANPRAMIAAGVGLVPEDRKHQALFLDMSVAWNATLAALSDVTVGPFISDRRDLALAAQLAARLSVVTGSLDQRVGSLSGGNQQKVVLARWLARGPAVLLLDEPTRGIDVGARQEIYRLIAALARDGMAVFFVSSEMEEVLTLADRVLVMHDGRLTGELKGDGLTEEAVMSLATGAAA